ncbi:MAG: fatty acid desaturase [Bradymonadaceae bacterium]|nr:fatty acid desaturase [Lujinxingiaceae bacterium]
MSTPPPPFRFDHVDMDTFLSEIEQLRVEIDASLGQEDIDHLQMIERLGKLFTAIGLATCWIAPNPVSALGLGLGRSTRWLLMHHIGHRGYDKVPGVPAKYTSKVFARGKRRFLDWADWMIPEAWVYEHNVLHHSYTGEEDDPDLIERNTEVLHNPSLPYPLRYTILGLLAVTWRSTYYAPNTMRTWLDRPAERKRRAKELGKTVDQSELADSELQWQLWKRCYAPYAALNFALLPAAYLPLGPWSAFSALCNSLMAEAVTNLHTFCVVGPNHTGDDLYRFADRPASRAEYYVRQVIGSVNFDTGSDPIDYLHLWLNYQIEHHIWPDIPMLKYRQFQPRVKALCEKYEIPYVQEGVFRRVKKMADIAVGKTSMLRMPAAA